MISGYDYDYGSEAFGGFQTHCLLIRTVTLSHQKLNSVVHNQIKANLRGLRPMPHLQG